MTGHGPYTLGCLDSYCHHGHHEQGSTPFGVGNIVGQFNDSCPAWFCPHLW